MVSSLGQNKELMKFKVQEVVVYLVTMAHLVHFWFWNPKAEFWIFFHMEANQMSNVYNDFLSVDGFHCLKCDMIFKSLLIHFKN